MLRLGICFAVAVLPVQALAQPAPVQQPPWLPEPPTRIEAAVARFVTCVSRQSGTLPASLGSEAGAAQVLAGCDAQLAAVEREAVRVINGSRLSQSGKARAIRDLRGRLAQTADRIAARIERRRSAS